MYIRGQPHLHPRRVGAPASPKIFGTYTRAHSMRNNNQILHGDQTRCEENFSGSTMPPAVAKIFDDEISIYGS